MKVVTVIGARPQFIKAAVLSRLFKETNEIHEMIVHTGQHFDANMSHVFFEEMDIPHPQFNLGINCLSHGAMTGQMLEKIENILIKERPDWVLVYGDTNSTLAGALAGKKLHIKVAHVEAGLRSYNLKMPEEINRILTDRISDILFCPTRKAVENLRSEGYTNMNVRIVESGDVMQDAALFYANKARKPNFNLSLQFILCTVHRAENTDNSDRLYEIFKALETIAERIAVVLPLHPRTEGKLKSIGFDFESTNIHFTSPEGYLEMIYLLKNCKMVITDSGGIQKEAYFFKKNCLTLRGETEWVELTEGGFNMLAGSDHVEILSNFDRIVTTENDFSRRLYGNGNAGEKIMRELLFGL